MDNFFGLLIVVGLVAIVGFIAINLLNALIEVIDELTPYILGIVAVGIIISVLVKSNTNNSLEVDYSNGLEKEYVNNCFNPIGIDEEEVFYTELNKHLNSKTDNSSIDERFDSLDSSISFLASHLAKINGKIDINNHGFNEYQRNMVNAFKMTNSEIFKVKSQIKKEWDDLRKEKRHQGFENFKVAYVSIIAAWALSVLLPPDLFSSKKNVSVKRKLRIKTYEYAGNYTNLRVLESSSYPYIADSYCEVKDKKILIFFKKLTKVSLTVVLATLLILGVDYLYYLYFS